MKISRVPSLMLIIGAILIPLLSKANSENIKNSFAVNTQFVLLQPNPGVTVDTIPSGNSIVLDTGVISFSACIIINGGVAIDKHYNGNILFAFTFLKPGTVIIIDNILFRNTNGSVVSRPPKKYIVS